MARREGDTFKELKRDRLPEFSVCVDEALFSSGTSAALARRSKSEGGPPAKTAPASKEQEDAAPAQWTLPICLAQGERKNVDSSKRGSFSCASEKESRTGAHEKTSFSPSVAKGEVTCCAFFEGKKKGEIDRRFLCEGKKKKQDRRALSRSRG